MLQHYQNRSFPQAAQLLEEDQITFSVLYKILQGDCTDIFTDGETVIVCYSSHPWPVWAWCRDPENMAAVTEIAQCLKENYPLEQGYDIILSHALLEGLKKQDGYFREAKTKMGLLSYQLDQLKAIDYPCEGSMSLVREAEIPSLIGVRHDMSMEMEGRDFTAEHCEESLRRQVGEKALFAWRKDSGEIVSLTARGDQPPYSKITSVYTLPQHRRKGYAINLVHAVTETILADGLIPILYTDAGYAASNACYQKIGYQQVGSLCSICK